jgi:hypothetical protein
MTHGEGEITNQQGNGSLGEEYNLWLSGNTCNKTNLVQGVRGRPTRDINTPTTLRKPF